jgi:NAD(P)H-hydrate repair Nnr-like enzyme with NAD(P)H-hydrate dehydratase domain
MNPYWLKQTVDKPLYDNLLWSRPENKLQAGKIVVIGGNINSFAKTVNSYQLLISAGVGQVTILLPKPIFKVIGQISTDLIFCPSTDSGSFSSQSLDNFIDYTSSADGIFLSGELSNNSETLILIEKLINRVNKPIILSDDSIDLALHFDNSLLNRNNMIYVGNLDKFQKIFSKLNSTDAITSNISLSDLVRVMKNFSQKNLVSLVTIYNDYVVVASQGQVSTTLINKPIDRDIFKLVHHCVCWIIQNPETKFQALSCSAITYQTI